MRESTGGDRLSAVSRWAQRSFRPHLRVFVLGVPAILLIDFLVSEGWWFFWPLLIWSLLLGLHYLYAAALGVDEEWAQRRAEEVADKAYDFDHIEDIRQRHEKARPGQGGGLNDIDLSGSRALLDRIDAG